jgi:hypothetical protein
MKIRTEKVIDLQDWDNLVIETYGRPYSFQQQDGCQGRGTFKFEVPNGEYDDYKNDTVPEIVNHDEMGVSFAAWLKRDPKAPLTGEGEEEDGFSLHLWWARNFYPEFQTVANDLYSKGLLEKGKYTIDIDW